MKNTMTGHPLHGKVIRILTLLLLAIMLHIGVLHWSAQYLGDAATTSRTIDMTLASVPLPEEPVRLPVATAPNSKPNKPATARPRQTSPTPSDNIADVTTPDTNNANASVNETPGNASDKSDAAGEGSGQEGIYYKAAPPPSATLSYDVIAIQHDVVNPYYGFSKIAWTNQGDAYAIRGDATALFFTLLSFRSHGTLGDTGLAPETYSEKPIRKKERQVYFQWQDKELRFSETDKKMPLSGGEQDRASIVWQLSAIGRGDPARFYPGAIIDIFVVGIKEGELWRLQVIGQETLSTGEGELTTWHVVRQPKPGSYEQRIDIWLALEKEWYPARIRYTEPNEDFLEMNLSGIATSRGNPQDSTPVTTNEVIAP